MARPKCRVRAGGRSRVRLRGGLPASQDLDRQDANRSQAESQSYNVSNPGNPEPRTSNFGTPNGERILLDGSPKMSSTSRRTITSTIARRVACQPGSGQIKMPIEARLKANPTMSRTPEPRNPEPRTSNFGTPNGERIRVDGSSKKSSTSRRTITSTIARRVACQPGSGQARCQSKTG